LEGKTSRAPEGDEAMLLNLLESLQATEGGPGPTQTLLQSAGA